jgi:hypothetical protein
MYHPDSLFDSFTSKKWPNDPSHQVLDIAWHCVMFSYSIAAICCLSAVGHIVHNSTVEEDDSSTRRLW